MRCLTAAVLAATVVSGVGCGPQNTAGVEGMEAIPAPPSLDALDPEVVRQYHQYREDLDLELAEPEPDPEQLAEAYGLLGMFNQAYVFFDPALACYANAARLDPEDPRWPYYAGRVHLARGRYPEARENFERVLGMSPNDVPTLVHLGEVEVTLGDSTRAQQHLERALQLDPQCVRALVALGRLAFNDRDFEHAVEKLQHALRLQPEVAGARYTLAQGLRELGDADAAAAELERIPADIDSAPPAHLRDPHWDALLNVQRGSQRYMKIGIKAYRERRIEPAIEAFRGALAANPDHVAAMRYLGMSLQVSGRVDEAIEIYETALQRDPESVPLRVCLGAAFGDIGRLAEAQDEFAAAVAADPECVVAHRNLAKLYRMQSRLELALSHTEIVCRVDPNLGLARFWRSATLLMMARHDEARSSIEADLQRFPNSRLLQLLLARVLAAAPVAGLRDGARALQLAPGRVAQGMGLFEAETIAMALAENGDFKAATRWQEAAVAAVTGSRMAGMITIAEERLEGYIRAEPCRLPITIEESPAPIRVQPPKE